MRSPSVVGRPILTDCMGAAVDICDSAGRAASVYVHLFKNNTPCGAGAGKGIDREFSQITSVNKIVQTLRSGVLVLSELVDRIAQRVKVFFEQSFFGMLLWSSNLPAATGRQHDCQRQNTMDYMLGRHRNHFFERTQIEGNLAEDICGSTCERQEYVLHFVPNFRVGIDNFEVIGVLHRYELHVLTGFLFLFCVAVAEFVRDVFVGGAMNEDLLRTNAQFCRRRFTVVVGHLGWRAAEKACDGIIAQVQLPAATQVEHAGQRKHAGDRRLMGSEAECKLATGRVSGNAEAVAIKSRKFMLSIENEAKSGANILKCSRPSASRIADAAVLNIAGGDSRQFESVA
jgi:hypothetical protein